MTKAGAAVALFKQGFNCSQAVWQSLDQTWTRSGYGNTHRARVGAGVARTDDICGAVSGAIMVIGLRYGGTRADDSAARVFSRAALSSARVPPYRSPITMIAPETAPQMSSVRATPAPTLARCVLPYPDRVQVWSKDCQNRLRTVKTLLEKGNCCACFCHSQPS